MNYNLICFPNSYPLYWIVDDPLDSAIQSLNNQCHEDRDEMDHEMDPFVFSVLLIHEPSFRGWVLTGYFFVSLNFVAVSIV